MKQHCPICQKLITVGHLARHQKSKYCQSKRPRLGQFDFTRLPTDLQLYVAEYVDDLNNWLVTPVLRSIARELIHRRYNRIVPGITQNDATIFFRFGQRRICTGKVLNYYHIPREVALTIPYDTFTNPYNHSGVVRLFRLDDVYKVLLQRHTTLNNFTLYRQQKLAQQDQRKRTSRFNRLIKELDRNKTALPDYDPLQLVQKYVNGTENNLDYIVQRIQQIRFLREYRSFDLIRRTFLSMGLAEPDLFARTEQFCLRYSIYPDIFPWQE